MLVMARKEWMQNLISDYRKVHLVKVAQFQYALLSPYVICITNGRRIERFFFNNAKRYTYCGGVWALDCASDGLLTYGSYNLTCVRTLNYSDKFTWRLTLRIFCN